MFLPIGHEKGVRRWPYVTLAIIVICTALQLYQSFAAPDEEDVGERLMRRMALVEDMVDQQMRDDADEAGLDLDSDEVDDEDVAAYQAIAERNQELAGRLAERKYEGVEHPRLAELEALDAEIDGLMKKNLVLRWAFHADDVWSVGLLLSIFVHAGWLHLIGNMLFLWLTGMSMEDRWGHGFFLGFYLLGGIVANLSFAAVHTDDGAAAVGASGAVASAMGGFLIAYWRIRVKILVLLYSVRTYMIRALWVFGLWIVEEVFWAWVGDIGVAHSAHVGGFFFGMAVAYGLRRSGYEEKHLMLADEIEEQFHDENPEVREARSYAALGNKSAAIATWEKMLQKDPGLAEARREICQLALDIGETLKAREHASVTLVGLVREGQASLAATLYSRLYKAKAADTLTDRALHDVVRSAIAIDQPALAVQAVRQMLAQHPHSSFLPGLMLQLSEVQERSGRPDLARRSLEMLVQKFPLDPLVGEAQARLRRLPPPN